MNATGQPQDDTKIISILVFGGLAVVLTTIIGWWFVYRPYKIRKDCAASVSWYLAGHDIMMEDYNKCLMENGQLK